MPLPSEKEEVWRYSPIDQLDLDRYRPAQGPSRPQGHGQLEDPLGQAFVDGLVADVPDRSALVVVHDGVPVVVDRSALPAEAQIGDLAVTDQPDGAPGTGFQERLGQVLVGGDALVRLNDAFLPGALLVDVPAGGGGSESGGGGALVRWCPRGRRVGAGHLPPHGTRVGRGAQAAVVEVVAGVPAGQQGLVVPVTELSVDEGGILAYVGLQVLGTGAWHIGRIAARAARDATLRTFTVGLGAAYDRSRTDAAAAGPGGVNRAAVGLPGFWTTRSTTSAPCRTTRFPDHQRPVLQGGSGRTSRADDSGLIRVRNGAVRIRWP